ncbi:hypothetical protein [Sunxiuqinia indica]|uniref:hypothetical protein n=1 Tax=Sunxiuqinia indica TaxID=2692584 RepID=UPI001358FA7B|nr:hypothetical protein [Sunxiuqinia indica]
MKTFYSILSINIRPEINERLSIGLLMICQEKVYFRYSSSKLSVIQKLIGKETYKATQQYLSLIENSVGSNEAISQVKGNLDLKVESKYDRLFSEQYISYLSRYNNNLVSFSNPNFVDLVGSEQIFNTLFGKFVDRILVDSGQQKTKQIDQFKRNYYPNVKPYFNIEQEINSTQFSRLLTPIKIDLMGKNDIEVFAQSIDFDKKTYSIEYNIGNLLQLFRALPQAKQFVLGIEPSKKLEVNHRIWNNIRSSYEFEYVDISEADRVIEYAQTHGVKPLFD